MAKCQLVMDVNPKATMISVRAESKLKITSLDNRDRWRCEDTVDRVRSAMISCGCVGAVSFQENFAEARVTKIAFANVWISSLASTRRTI
jgi:hypothetical protein